VKRINCVCGYLIEAEDDDDLLANVERHVADAHPDLVGKLSRQDILGMAKDE
jgi:predicted small metal-binding protein